MVGNSPRNKKAPKKTKNTLMDTTLFGLLFKPFDDKYFALVNFAIRLLFGLLKKCQKYLDKAVLSLFIELQICRALMYRQSLENFHLHGKITSYFINTQIKCIEEGDKDDTF